MAEEQPVGTLEAALVERVAVCLWRLRRAVTAESASLHLQRETLGAEDWQLIEQLTGVSDRGLILGTLRQGWSLAEAEDYAQVFDTWLALPDADKPQDLAALTMAFPPLVALLRALLRGLLTAAEAGLASLPAGKADSVPPAVAADAAVSGDAAGALVSGDAAVEREVAGALVSEVAVVADELGAAVSLGEVLAARSGGSLTELLYGVHDHFRQQLAILRAVSPLRAARLHPAAAEPMARYQAALDNEWYKAIRALREAQAQRRANAALEGVAQAA